MIHRDGADLPLQFGVSLFTTTDTDMMRPLEITETLQIEKYKQANKTREYIAELVAQFAADVAQLRKQRPPPTHYHSFKVADLTGSATTEFTTLQLDDDVLLSIYPTDIEHFHEDSASLLVQKTQTGAMFKIFEDVIGGNPADTNRGLHHILDVIHITRLDAVHAQLEQLGQSNSILVATCETHGNTQQEQNKARDSIHQQPPSVSITVPTSSLSPSGSNDHSTCTTATAATPTSSWPRLPRPRRQYLRGFLGEENAARRRTLQLVLRWYVHQERQQVEHDLWHTAALLFNHLPLLGLENPANYTLLERLALVQACSAYAEHFCDDGMEDSDDDSDCDSDTEPDVDNLSSGTDDDEVLVAGMRVNKKRKLRGFWLQQVARNLYPLKSEMLQSHIVAEWESESRGWNKLLHFTLSDLAEALLRERAA